MINLKDNLFKWGPIPGRLLTVSHWTAIYHWYKRRLHHYYWPDSFIVFYKEKMLFVNSMDDLEAVGKRVFRNIILTPKREKFWQVARVSLFKLQEFCRSLNKTKLKKLSNQQLIKQWKELNQLILDFWEPMIIPELGAYGGAAILKDTLKKEKLAVEKENLALSVLSAPARFSFYQEEEADLLKIVQKFRSKEFSELLNQHVKKYFWIKNSYYRSQSAKQDYFLKVIKQKTRAGLKPKVVIREMKFLLKSISNKKKIVLAQLKNKKEIRRISNGLIYCIWWQDQRKKYIFQYLHYLQLMVDVMASRAKVNPRLFDFAWPDEVTVNPSPGLIATWQKRRNQRFAVYFTRNKKKNVYAENAVKVYKTFWEGLSKAKTKELKGAVVYSDKAMLTGRVFIIKQPADLKRFPKNRILVATMTAPEYITAIRKAKAIITDHGGLTCHAAIVARELKVPCIVGTQIATQVLQNSDLVRIYTERGMIKILR